MAGWGRQQEFGWIWEHLQGRREMEFLEFGCVRDETSVQGDGHSTVFLATLAKHTNSNLYSVDISSEAIRTAKKVLQKENLYPSSNIIFVEGCASGVAAGWETPLDFLLLDGCDKWPTGDPEAFAKAHKDVFCSLEKHMKPGSVVMVDDTSVRGPQVIPYMGQNGWTAVLEGIYGTILVKS